MADRLLAASRGLRGGHGGLRSSGGGQGVRWGVAGQIPASFHFSVACEPKERVVRSRWDLKVGWGSRVSSDFSPKPQEWRRSFREEWYTNAKEEHRMDLKGRGLAEGGIQGKKVMKKRSKMKSGALNLPVCFTV